MGLKKGWNPFKAGFIKLSQVLGALLIFFLFANNFSFAQCNQVTIDWPTSTTLHFRFLAGKIEAKVEFPKGKEAIKVLGRGPFDTDSFAGLYVKSGELAKILAYLDSTGKTGRREKKLRVILVGFLGDAAAVKWIAAYLPFSSSEVVVLDNLSGVTQCHSIKSELWGDMITAPAGFETVEEVLEVADPDMVYERLIRQSNRTESAKAGGSFSQLVSPVLRREP